MVAGFGRGGLWLRGILCLGAIRPLYPHNLRVLLKLSKKHLLVQKPYTGAAQSGCKTLRRIRCLQLIAAEHTKLLNRNNANVGHISLLGIIFNCLVRHTELLGNVIQTLALFSQTFNFFDGVSARLWSAMLLALGARLSNAGAYSL